MGLKDSVLAETKSRGGTCSLVRVYAGLSKKDAAELREVLAMPNADVNHAMIVRALTGMGHKLSTSTVGRHRALECSCGAL